MKLRHFIVGAMVLALAAGSIWSVSANAQLMGILHGGRLALTASSSAPMFNLTSMRPGSRSERSITIRNTGTLAADWQLRASSKGAVSFLRRLRVNVVEWIRPGGRISVYAGSLAALGRVALGVLPSGAAREFVFVVTWPRDAPAAPGAVAEAAAVDLSWYASAA